MRGLIRVASFLVLILVVMAHAPLVHSQPPAPGAAATSAAKPPAAGTGAKAAAPAGADMGFWEFMVAGGSIGWVIVALSVAGVALAVDLTLFLRGEKIIPAGLAESVQEALRRGQLAQADQQCRLHNSVLARMLVSGMQELDGGWPAVEKTLEDGLADEGARIFRKIEYLSIIGNVAPMLGLLGTVVGMIVAFKQVADTQGAARAADLAGGIYQALVTTVQGLVVAIPALMAYAYFRGWTEEILTRCGATATQVFLPLRKGRGQAAARAAAAAGSAGGAGGAGG